LGNGGGGGAQRGRRVRGRYAGAQGRRHGGAYRPTWSVPTRRRTPFLHGPSPFRARLSSVVFLILAIRLTATRRRPNCLPPSPALSGVSATLPSSTILLCWLIAPGGSPSKLPRPTNSNLVVSELSCHLKP
jgi:hypothetical protein